MRLHDIVFPFGQGDRSQKKTFFDYNKQAFSIIEIMVGIFIFSLGITSVYTIILSTLKLNDYNKNYIIASNLASEQIELVRNIRDSNYFDIKKYNQINPATIDYGNIFDYGQKYKIENNYSTTATFPIKVYNITTGFEEGINKLTGSSMQDYRLCIDLKNRYTYDCNTIGNNKTSFYKYISIEQVQYMNEGIVTNINNAFLIKSKVIWYKKGYHEFEVKSIIADWKRL